MNGEGTMFLSLLELILLVLMPGLAGWLAFGQPLKRHICLSEALYLIMLTGVAAVSWLALVLAEVGWFSLPLLLGLVVVTSLGLVGWAAWKRHGLDAFRGLRIEPSSVAVLGVIAVAVLLPSRPFEYILGGRDHGVYVNTGVNIAKTEGIIFQDSELVAVPVESQQALVLPQASVYKPGLPGPWSEGQRLPGFALRDLEKGIVIPHAFHLYPVWIAIFYAIGGLSFALWTTFAFSLLGALGLYMAGTRLFGRPVGLLASFLLVISVGQTWFARYPSAEIVVQFLFWSGLFAFSLLLETHNRYAACLSACAFGLIHLTKADIVFVPIVLLIVLAYVWLKGRFHRHHWSFVAPYALLLIHAGVHALFISTVYSVDHAVRNLLPPFINQALVRAAEGHPYPLDILSRGLAQNLSGIALGLMLMGALVFLALRSRQTLSRGLTLLGRYEQLGRLCLVLSLGFLALYAYFLQPRLRSGSLPSSLVMVGWYVAPLGVLLATAGFLQAVTENAEDKKDFAWLMALGNTLYLLIAGSKTSPDHFWAIRRFVPVAIPAFFLFASYLLWQLMPRRWSHWPRGILPLGLAIVLALNCLGSSWPLLRVVEYEGMIEQLSQLAASLPRSAVLLFDQSDAGNRVTAPLWLIFDRTVFMVTAEAMNDPSLTAALEAWRSEGRDVYWVSTLAQSPNPQKGWTTDYISTHVLEAPLVENPVGSLPQEVGRYAITLDVHRVVTEPSLSERRIVLTPTAGTGVHDQHVIEGLYNPERRPGLTPNRWTSGQVSFSVAATGQPIEIILRMANGRPWDAPAPKASVYLANHLVRTITVKGGFEIYSFSVPQEAARNQKTIELRLTIKPWNPRKAGYSQDERDLGVLLDWVKIVVEE